MSAFLLIMLFGQPIYELDEVVVTANRYHTLLQDVNVAVMIIEREEIEQLNALSLNEVLNGASGIDFKDYGAPGSVTSISTRGIPSNGTLVLVNGQPLNAVTNGMADLSVIDINTIERIEIVKGPVSSIYGANALGGVVNILTVAEAKNPEAGVRFTPATTTSDNLFQTTNTSFRLGLPVNTVSFNLAGAYTHDAGRRSNSDLTKYHFTGAISYRTDRLTIRSSLFYDQKEYGIPGPLPHIDSTHSIPQFGDSTATSLHDREHDRALLGNLNLDLQISENIKWYNRIFADRKHTEFHTTYAGMVADTVNEDYDYLAHRLGFSTLLTVRQKAFDYVIGMDLHYDTLQAGKVSNSGGDTIWQASSYNSGAWSEVRMHLAEGLSLTPSIRYDHNSQFGGFLAPGIGFVSALDPHVWLKFSVGKTFRAPTFNDLYWPQSGNPQLQPEHGWAYELRCETSPITSLYTAFSFFLRNVKDRIAWLPGASNLWQPQNLHYLSIKGLDLEIRHHLSESVNYSIEVTYLRARQKNEEIVYTYYDWINDTSLTITNEIERQAAFTPKLAVSSQINLTLPLNSNFNITGQYLSERLNYYPNYDSYPHVTMDEKTLKSYVVINSALNVDIHRNLAVSFGVKNILDADYAAQFGNTVIDFDYPMPARTYFMQFSLQLLQKEE
jgi:outer membrane cobalamin receptor